MLGTAQLAKLKGKRCFVSWSGGKDGCLAMHRAVQAGARIEVVVNMMVESGDRSRSHGLRSAIIEAQARSMGLRLESVATSWEAYEKNFIGILQRIREQGIEAGIFGDIDLQAHLDWERMVCDLVGITPALPLWQGERKMLVREFLDAGFETRLVAVRADFLSPDYLGQAFSLDLAETFEKRGVDACGENGEFHTVVTDGPCFRQSLEIVPGERVLKDGYWFLDFEMKDAVTVRRKPSKI